MKKHRGLRRYYKTLATVNDFDKITWLDFNDDNTWFDNWHLHFDWHGYGNTSFKRRKPHLDKLFRHFDLLEEKTRALKIDFQLYAVLYEWSSYDDALFLHTANPNGSEFPLELENPIKDNILKNAPLCDYITALTSYEKLFFDEEEPYCVLYKEGIGVPLARKIN